MAYANRRGRYMRPIDPYTISKGYTKNGKIMTTFMRRLICVAVFVCVFMFVYLLVSGL